MSGTARCMDCGVSVVHERGPGSPLILKHRSGCPALPHEHICILPIDHSWATLCECYCGETGERFPSAEEEDNS